MKILIVDDKEENRYMLEILFKGNGHDTLSASNGAEALEHLKSGRIDLIISDILMPVMDGFELCRKVRADNALAGIPFIIYTATYTGPQDEEFAKKIGADRFILKPCEPELMLNTIRDITIEKQRNNIPIQAHPEDQEVLKLYNERLIRKLEQKMLQLEKSEELFKNLFKYHAAVKLIVDPDTGNIIDANEAAVNYYGWPHDQIIRMNIQDINALPPEEVKAAIKKVRDQKKYHFEFRHRRADGSIRDVEIYSSNIKVHGKDILHSIVYDITERKQIEEELKKYREHLEEIVKERTNDLAMERNLLRTLIDSLPDQIYAKDNDNRYIIANPNVLHSFGKTNTDEIIGKTDFELLPQKEAMKGYTAEHAVLTSKGKMFNFEEPVTDPKGNILWHSSTKVPLKDSEGRVIGLVGITRDITESKQAEENLQKAKEAAEAANRAKSTFLSNMSHEIRTPLNAILGFSQLMQSDNKISKEHRNWLGTINRSGEHLLALINDILEVSRIEAGRVAFNPSSFDLQALFRDIEAMFRIKTDEKKLNFIFEYLDELPRYVVTDEGKLRQIMVNLVGNAVKFTKEGGIALRARVKEKSDKMRFTVEIEDTGPGIAEKDIDKLFQKFGQTATGIREGGTGLGLAISQQYAKIMGGEITVKSSEGKGTCFILTIDIEKSKDIVKEKNQKKRVIGLKPGQKQYRILVADDRSDNRELLKVMLTSVGFELEEAKDGNETIEKFKAWSPDLILLDMRMPVMDGYETIRGIRAIEEKKTPIIAVTASAFQEDKQKTKDSGADGYLRKPFKEHEVFERIESYLDVQYVYR
jgi:PAS domain S-box-containing protein